MVRFLREWMAERMAEATRRRARLLTAASQRFKSRGGAVIVRQAAGA